MLLIGLWHGASWNFVIWGGLHGIFLAVFTVLRKKYTKSTESFFKTKFGKISSIFITQYLVFLTFIAFRIQNLDHMSYAMQKYIFLDFSFTQTIEIIKNNEFPILLIILFVILHYFSYKKGNLPEKISNLKLRYWTLFLFCIIVPISLFYVGSAQEFIYFEF